jgi:hypothetical protein
MESEGSFPSSQEPSTGPQPELDEPIYLPNSRFATGTGFITKTLYVLPFLPMLAICPAHLVLINLLILITFDEQQTF